MALAFSTGDPGRGVIEANSSDGKTSISSHDPWAYWQKVDKTGYNLVAFFS